MPRQASSAKVKLLRGVTPSRVNRNEPEPRDLPPEPPAFLDDRAMVYWQALTEETASMGTLCKLDSFLMGLYCDALARADRAREIMSVSGMLTADSNMAPKRHPAEQIRQSAIAEVVRLSRELGLSPSVRHGLSVAKRDEDGSERLLD
jgi:P27 family predicted phage terminase small subunit